MPWDVAGRLRGLLACSSGYVQITLLSALNMAGNQLPKLMALFLAKVVRSSSFLARADASFDCYFDPPPRATPVPVGRLRAAARTAASAARSAARFAWLALLFAPVLLSAPLVLRTGWRRAEWLALLTSTLEAAGPAFQKYAQWAATRRDLFAPDVCAALAKLQTQVPAHAFEHTLKAIEQSFGMPVAELFSSIDPVPVASGSIGQVHRAVLAPKGAAIAGCPPGAVVAIKARHPGADVTALSDFAAMTAVAHALEVVPSIRALRLGDTLAQFSGPLAEQVDLSREAQHLAAFHANFAGSERIVFPRPLHPLVSPSVLVESFEPGDHISAFLAACEAAEASGNGSTGEDSSDGAAGAVRRHGPRLAALGTAALLQMLLRDNLIHSDLHPGNILVRLQPPPGPKRLAHSAAEWALARAPLRGSDSSNAAKPLLCSDNDTAPSGDAPAQLAGGKAMECTHPATAWHQADPAPLVASSTGCPTTAPELSVPSVSARAPRNAAPADVGSAEPLAAAAAAAMTQGVRTALQRLQAACAEPQLVLLDVGVATRLSDNEQRTMVGLFSAFGDLDGRATAERVLEFAGEAQACTDAEPFKRDMERAFSALRVAEASGDWRGTPYGSNTDALAAALETVRRHGVTLPGGVCSVMVTTLILEGWSSQLDPGHSVLNQVREMLGRSATSSALSWARLAAGRAASALG